MWCSVQVCHSEGGRRLARQQWKPLGIGDLTIGYGPKAARTGLVARLTRPDVEHPVQIGYPIFDVRVSTYEDGLIVVGFKLEPDLANSAMHEVRQAWYCIPAPRA